MPTLSRPVAAKKSPRAALWFGYAVSTVLVAFFGCGRAEPPSNEPSPNGKPDSELRETQRTIARKQPEVATTRIRLATYNINYGNPDLPSVADAIKKADADAVCVQETNSRSAAFLRQTFGKQYPEIRFNGTVRPYRAGGFAVLSRLPVKEEHFIKPLHGLFGIHMVQIEIGGHPIDIFSLHLRPTRLPRAKGLQKLSSALAAFSNTEKTHSLEIQQVLEHVRPNHPTIIAGDFNSLSSGVAPSTLIERAYADCFAAANEPPEKHPTWHWHTKYGEIALRIDYIFHSASIQTLESRVIRSAGSDHYLLVSELEFAPGPVD